MFVCKGVQLGVHQPIFLSFLKRGQGLKTNKKTLSSGIRRTLRTGDAGELAKSDDSKTSTFSSSVCQCCSNSSFLAFPLELFIWIIQSLSAQTLHPCFHSRADCCQCSSKGTEFSQYKGFDLIFEIFLPTSTSILYTEN